MPGPLAMPSQGATVLNSTGMPPASRTPSFTAAARSRRWRWPGVVSVQELTTAMVGRAKSSSVKPAAR